MKCILCVTCYMLLSIYPKFIVWAADKNTDANVQNTVEARYVPERSGDFAWENDLVAFRAYGPPLRSKHEDSGIDCWLKRVKYPIINKWYALSKEGKSYHKDNGEGLDCYSVGSSRGCGGTAIILENGKFVTSDTFVKYKIISKTPDEAVFSLDYVYGDTGVTETKTIEIHKGKRLFKVKSLFLLNGKPAKLKIAVGITTHKNRAKEAFDVKKGWMACWENFGRNGNLGTGVIIKGAEFTSKNDHLWGIKETNEKGEIVYYSGYGWSKAGEITSYDKWKEYLNTFTTD